MYDWVLFLHILSGFVLAGALTALWVLVAATRPAGPVLAAEEARRYGRVAGPLVGAGLGGTLLFGIWLAIQSDEFRLWDGWVLGSLALWALAVWAGARAGQQFERDPVGRRRSGIVFQAVSSGLVVIILALMFWKPGA